MYCVYNHYEQIRHIGHSLAKTCTIYRKMALEIVLHNSFLACYNCRDFAIFHFLPDRVIFIIMTVNK